MKGIVYSHPAQRALARMPRNWAIRIRDKISVYAEDPAVQSNNVRKLKGQDNLIRLRVGNWRVIMRDDAVLLILNVRSRAAHAEERRP
jgi:mRNA interferase RelE/StbE